MRVNPIPSGHHISVVHEESVMNTITRSIGQTLAPSTANTAPVQTSAWSSFTTEAAALLRAVFSPRSMLDEVQAMRAAQLKAQGLTAGHTRHERRLSSWVGMD